LDFFLVFGFDFDFVLLGKKLFFFSAKTTRVGSFFSRSTNQTFFGEMANQEEEKNDSRMDKHWVGSFDVRYGIDDGEYGADDEEETSFDWGGDWFDYDYDYYGEE